MAAPYSPQMDSVTLPALAPFANNLAVGLEPRRPKTLDETRLCVGRPHSKEPTRNQGFLDSLQAPIPIELLVARQA